MRIFIIIEDYKAEKATSGDFMDSALTIDTINKLDKCWNIFMNSKVP